MFIETDLENRAGVEAERKVWDAVKGYFAGRNSFAFLHYPMFNRGHQGRKEIDILLVDQELGVTVIEVKGIRIDQIESIQGHVWTYRDFYTDKGNPYSQAEQQLYMLCNKLEKNPLLYRSFSKRVVIALPNITRSEWEMRGFDKLLHSPPILFQDDLLNNISILESYFIVKANEPLNNRQWSIMKSLFSIMDEAETSFVPQEAYFSKLYILSSEEQFVQHKAAIEQALSKGLKIFLLSYVQLPEQWINQFKPFRDEYQLLIYTNLYQAVRQDAIVIQDGEQVTETIQEIITSNFPKFNLGQYKASHAPLDEHLMVTAGAGTGKTHVMIDRILFLLAKGELSLKDVIMITFTNDSTNEMKERLQKKLIHLSKLTGRTKYLLYAEDIKEMQISTIHSYAKSIIVSLAHELGLGRNVQLRSFVKTKKDIIEQLANEYFRTKTVKGLVQLKFPHYELINVMYDFWEEMEKKGLTKKEIMDLDWGQAKSTEYESVHGLFEYVFKHCEDKLDQEKKKENAVSMGDLIRKIKDFSQDQDKMVQIKGNKFLFVDEFQDSDNVQIEMVASLANYLNYQLFVVGDVKQSIYRFRGADYRSFDVLDSKVKANSKQDTVFTSISLNQNYRTSTSILNKLDQLFVEWGKKGWLSYSKDDRLEGATDAVEKRNEFQFISVRDNKRAELEMVDAIKESLSMTKALPKDKNRKIALIVRTNSQAKAVNKWCDVASITTLQNLDGTFFTSDAVRDFKYLLEGLLYPNDAKYVLNALQTPYFRYEIPFQVLLPFSGESRRILDFIHSKIGKNFTQYVEQLKVLPIMAIIQKIISEKGIFEHLSEYSQKRKAQGNDEINIQQYKVNLFHLMNMIQQQFDTMSSTLFTLHEWLTLQIRTNRTENEPMIETTEQTVEITTVHRSKGLEYHTVIIPKTDYQFESDRDSFYIQEENEMIGGKRKVGWYLKNRDSSSYYDQLNTLERNETNKEETRLLYVAMTRTKERLVVILPEQDKKQTWSSLIKATGNKGVRNDR
ncbi:DNA helicase-2/ATP-dependent DNA helicase PcrA [Bacillus mesophilus]|uniref:DNA 3'-5' helicase n=1 Tax=Bacillus mesophilus TaxID=1808955 RepID=A0A6M0Q4D3_9BACI|nr:UvrD-helicase domain-containing protein [Bacillus mesophilus]MBM7660393.1 DNA helicase-2/ATP-dependent DNA helicase PcrA [Bacillus mesophilus]NEY71102.1 UvrD-helicase domain-containing protein [Bacillus mesophilus]